MVPFPPKPRVLVTRSAHQASELAQHLLFHGLEPVTIPAIEIIQPTSFNALDAALTHLLFSGVKRFHSLPFTSAHAVESFAARRQHVQSPGSSGLQPAESSPLNRGALAPGLPALKGTGFNPSGTIHNKGAALAAEGSLCIAAIGPSTATALRNIGLEPTLIPPQAIAESLTEALLPCARQPDGTPTRFLLIRAEQAREHLPETLRAAGAEVTVAPAYRTIIPEDSVHAIRQLFVQPLPPPKPDSTRATSGAGTLQPLPVHVITFTSSSTARNLLALCDAAGVALPENALRISIGPITSQTLCDLGYPPHAEAPEATTASLAETVVNTLKSSLDA